MTRRNAVAAIDVDMNDVAASDENLERPRGDVAAAGERVIRRVDVRADMKRVARITRPETDVGVERRRNVNDHFRRALSSRVAKTARMPRYVRSASERGRFLAVFAPRNDSMIHFAEAITFNSTSIGVG